MATMKVCVPEKRKRLFKQKGARSAPAHPSRHSSLFLMLRAAKLNTNRFLYASPQLPSHLVQQSAIKEPNLTVWQPEKEKLTLWVVPLNLSVWATT
jgi:hypothetical protein